MNIVDFESRIAGSLRLSTHLSYTFFLLAYLRLVLFRDQWCFDVGKGKRVEYNGARRGLVLANKEHCRTVLSTMERDVALFRRTKNMVEPRFGEQRTLSNRVEYNGARRGLVLANKEHSRTSFWSTRPGLSTSC